MGSRNFKQRGIQTLFQKTQGSVLSYNQIKPGNISRHVDFKFFILTSNLQVSFVARRKKGEGVLETLGPIPISAKTLGFWLNNMASFVTFRLYLLTSLYYLQVFSFARYDPSLSFSTEHWYDIWPSKQLDPLKKKLVLQVLIARKVL